MAHRPAFVRPSALDRLLGVVDLLRRPRATRALAGATDGFRAGGVIRVYANDERGRRQEAIENGILWHRGYRPPTRITHNAMWWTGGPSVTITYSREVVRQPMTEREAEIARRLGVDR
jgi:hypothetical protein